MGKKPADQFSKRESKARLEAALRGSRRVGPKPMKEMAQNRGSSKGNVKGRS